ncbi:MAG: hypothetical protein ACTSSA_06795 [Candidatus Freyarchaeota archaeon]
MITSSKLLYKHVEKKIDFYLVIGQPGVGKTRSVIQHFLRSGKKVLFLSKNHSLLRELKEKYPSVGYWQGALRLCKNSKLKRLLEIGISPSYVCPLCNTPCEYKEQFDFSKQFTVAPVEYLHTSYIQKLNPDIIVLDDIIEEVVTLPPLVEVRRWLAEWSIACDYYFTFGLPLPSLFYVFYKATIRNLVNMQNLEPFTYLFRYTPSTYEKVIRNISEYRRDEDEVTIPLLVEVKDFEGLKVVVGSNQELIELYKERYGLKFETLELPHQQTNSKIVRCGSGWYPLTSLYNKRTLKRIERDINRIILREGEKRRIKKIGLISYKSILPKLNILNYGANWSATIEKEHFQNLKGINRMENCDVCFVVGTYVTNLGEFKKKYTKQFGFADFSSTKRREGGYRYKDKGVETYRRCMDDDEMYQAIHRYRPGIRDVTIYVFGLIPKKIREEFEVIETTPSLPKSISRKDAYKRYGRRRVDRWVQEGKLTKKYKFVNGTRIVILEKVK